MLVHFALPPRPRLHKRLHASHPQFCNSRVLSDVFFVPAILYTHVFCIFCSFFTNLLPALGGEHTFESCMCVKSSKNVPLSTPSYTKSHRKILSWGHLLQVKMYKFPLKNQHFLIMAFLGCVFRVPPVVPCLLAFLESPFLSKFAGFFQKVLPALGGEHIFKTHFKHCAFKISLF